MTPSPYTATMTLTDRRDRRFGWLMASPSLALLFVVILFPVFWAFFTSLHDYTLIAPNFDTFTGTGNFIKAAEDGEFRHSLGLTAMFVVGVVLLEFVLGFLVALALNKVERFKAIYYAILLCPLLMNPVIVGLIWRMFLHPNLGIVNYLLSVVGIPPVNWLGSTNVAIWTIILVDIWHQVSFMIVLLLAGLSALPKEPYEAARVDGASSFTIFWRITIPMLMRFIQFAFILTLITAFTALFSLIFVMTGGGPGYGTTTLEFYVYQQGFTVGVFGYAAAIGIVLFAVVFAISVAQLRIFKSRLD